ncbi:hypothetical protein ABEV41_11300 [Geobacillus thermodenitrificans]|jgi:hypothetical protein|uniref:hypothetical protein n=1 Tax=Geobacillus thermodenitrificans TaxID=33940 RepID=UPI000C291927|nr:hypothetical protein [Geobacillus thermodenitrificans]PJW19175.1 hypothetical protein CV632_17595 [Geobacillus thermodenitrificans]
MQIKKLSFDELPACVAGEITSRYKDVQLIEVTMMEFETVAEPMYMISLLDLDRNIIVEMTFIDGKINHESIVTLRTVLRAMKKYPDRFSLKRR